MKKIKKILLVFIASIFMLTVVSCDGKRPEKGYLSETEINEVVRQFDASIEPDSYSLKGNLNYFDITGDVLPGDVELDDLPFTPYNEINDDENKYLENCASYFLGMPLQINDTNWNYDNDDWNTQYQIESKLYRTVGSMDRAYYYKTAEGGLIIKCFGVNKELKINNTKLYNNNMAGDYIIEIECSGKWNITVEYNPQGLLISESFETLNKSENKKDCCYGNATYEYF